jgi:hypothetical protein
LSPALIGRERGLALAGRASRQNSATAEAACKQGRTRIRPSIQSALAQWDKSLGGHSRIAPLAGCVGVGRLPRCACVRSEGGGAPPLSPQPPPRAEAAARALSRLPRCRMSAGLDSMATAVSGALSAVAAKVIIYPLDWMKLRLSVKRADESAASIVTSALKSHGIGGIYMVRQQGNPRPD